MGVVRITPKMAAAKKTTTPTKPKPKRLIIDVEPEIHRQIKVAAATAGVSVRDFVLAMLKERGIG